MTTPTTQTEGRELTDPMQIVRRIRACESEVAAQLVLEHALKERPVQEPVAWYHNDFGSVELSRIPRAGWKPLYTTPPLPVQPERQPLTDERTTFVQRFSDAIALMCGAEPPAEFVDEWLRNVEVNFVARLQEWVLTQDGTPWWAQGIVVLDAAYLLAESPEEGGQHEDIKP